MLQIAYHSSTAGLLSADGIAALLVASRAKNTLRGITGMFLYKNGDVLQVMEGENQTVLALFDVIQADPRHRGVIRLYEKPILERDFPDWTMGFYDLDAEGASTIEGYKDIFGNDSAMRDLKPSAAAKLIAIFRKLR